MDENAAVSEGYRWQPATVAQKTALDSTAQILFFGGSAGSLKTATMLMDAAQEYENPHLRAIVFRESYTEMEDIIDKSKTMYPPLGGEYVGSPKYCWTFRSGAKVRFAYIKGNDGWRKYLGPRYSFIAFDESTQHAEKQVRNILGRLSSTDKKLRLRARLGSNPGGVGASWHQEVFLRGHCPIHDPDKKCAVAGKLYTDRYWPSDKKPIKATVAFVPGKLSDHNLLDEEYHRRLDEMEGAAAAAMKDGCWCTLEGAYFPFLNKTMIRPLADCGIEPWHAHFISIDYGYGQSYAAAALFVRGPAEIPDKVHIQGIKSSVFDSGPSYPNGRIRQIAEILVPMTPADEFARMILHNFVIPDEGQQQRSIVAVFLDPANFNASHDERVGTAGHAVSDQIDKVLEPWGLTCQRASNNRVGGWQLLHRMLRDGEFEFTDACPQAYEAIRTRMIDPEKSGDLIKVAGDKLDDTADVVRYGLFSFINPAQKPRELQLKEAIAGFDRSTREGLTSAMIHWEKKSAELDREAEPLRMGRRLGLGQHAMRRR